MKANLVKLKYYVVFVALLIGVYTYAGLTGWRFFGANTEKWEPEGHKEHHK